MRQIVIAAALVLCTLTLAACKPVQLFKPNHDHSGLLPCEAGLEALAAVNKPVAVVSVVGPYRSGKSFLLNQMLDQTAGFDLGSTVEPVTMGVWFWDQPPMLNQTALILLDTEGLYSPHVPASYDAKMFALSLIFSSTLIYNELGVLSQQSVDRFQYLTRLTINFLEKTGESESAIGVGAGASASSAAIRAPTSSGQLDQPSFFWVLEDFNLDLGSNQTPEQWLTHFLRAKKADGTPSANPQTLKLFGAGAGDTADIAPLFSSVNVALLSFPHYEPEKMKHLDRLKPSDLLPTYQSQVKSFKQKLFASAKPKRFGTNIALGGKELSGLMRVVVNGMNIDGRFPNITSAWDLYLQFQNSDAAGRALSGYDSTLQKLVDINPPVEAKIFGSAMLKAERDALTTYERHAVSGEAGTIKLRLELADKLKERQTKFSNAHLQALDNFCKEASDRRKSDFDRVVNAYIAVPKAEPDLVKFLASESDKSERVVCGGELCSVSHCTKLRDELSKRSTGFTAQNRLAIQDACRTAKTKALAFFALHGGREATPIMDDDKLTATLTGIRSLAFDHFNSLAPVAASERATNEYYAALSEALTEADASLRAGNAAARMWRYFFGFLIPAAVLAAHILFSCLDGGGCCCPALPKVYHRTKVLVFVVALVGWLFIMFWRDAKYWLLLRTITDAN